MEVVEEEVEVEVAFADFQAVLAANEGEATPKFEQEFLDVLEQAGLQFALVEGFFQSEEIKEVGIFEEALRDGGVSIGQGAIEVGDGGTLALVGAVF